MAISTGVFNYKEMCTMFGEKKKGGKAKQLQLQDWTRYCRYERPTKQKFDVKEVYEKPLAKTDGRKSNGRKSDTQQEFEYLLNAYIYREVTRNQYHCSESNHETTLCAYFTSGEIAEYFGLYDKHVYEGKKKELGLSALLYDSMMKKLTSMRTNRIISKIKKISWIETTKMIRCYKEKGGSPLYYDGEHVEMFEEAMASYRKKNDLKSIGDAIEQGKWKEMISSATSQFNAHYKDELDWFEDISICYRITPDWEVFSQQATEYTLEEIEAAKHSFNRKTCVAMKRLLLKETAKLEIDSWRAGQMIADYLLLEDWRQYSKISFPTPAQA